MCVVLLSMALTTEAVGDLKSTVLVLSAPPQQKPSAPPLSLPPITVADVRRGHSGAVTQHGVATSLTARKPTDSQLGAFERRLREVAAVQVKAMGPVSLWPAPTGASLRTTRARPPLAVELEAFLARELNLLSRRCPNADALTKSSIAREALGCFIGHFSGEYAAPLGRIHGLLNDAIEQALALQQVNHALASSKETVAATHAAAMKEERLRFEATVSEYRTKLAALERLSEEQQTRQRVLETELTRVAQTLSQRNQQLDDSESRAVLFERAILDLTEKNVAAHHKLLAARREIERQVRTVTLLEQQVREAENTATENFLTARRSRSKSIAALPLSPKTSPPASGVNSVFAPPRLAPGATLDPAAAEEDDDLESAADVYALEAKLRRATRLLHSKELERKSLLQRLENLQASIERERNDMTPRPPWVSATEVLPGFTVSRLATSEETLGELVLYFKEELSEGKRANERNAMSQTIREWLAQEDLCEGDLVARRHRYIPCRGTGSHVPIYLRAKGVVRNRRLRKGDVESLIGRFWSDRRLHVRIETAFNATPLPEYFHGWLRELTGTRKGAVELAYNIVAVCEQYQHDPDCAMFLRILRGELCEDAIFDQQDMLVHLREVLRLNDKQNKKVLSRFTIHRILNKFFPTKSQNDMLRLRLALALSSKGQTLVDYESLFVEDDEANQSRFIELIRRQHVEEATVFTVEVEEALREAIRPDDGLLDINNARMALKHLDPAMPNTRIEEIMAFGCAMGVSELEAHGQYFAVPAEPFLARLRSGMLLKRYSRRSPVHDPSSGSSSSSGDEEDDMSHGGGDRDGVHEDDFDQQGRLREIFVPDVKALSSPGPSLHITQVSDSSAAALRRNTLLEQSSNRRTTTAAPAVGDLQFLRVFRRLKDTPSPSQATSRTDVDEAVAAITPLNSPGRSQELT